MAEYLHPGVYVVEIDANAHPIDGVSTSIGAPTREALARALAAVVRQHVPDWTDVPTHDPGVTLMQLFAFLGEQLLYRSSETKATAERLATVAAVALAGVRTSLPPSGALRDVRFFSGKFLRASDFTREQNASRELRRYIRLLHGYGIVEGLDVDLRADGTNGESTLRVGAGVAIAPGGELIELIDGVAVALSCTDDAAFVVLHNVPSCEGRCGERAEVAIVRAATSADVTLARLLRADGRWAIDSGFVPPRARR